jgi:hypothetical protein
LQAYASAALSFGTFVGLGGFFVFRTIQVEETFMRDDLNRTTTGAGWSGGTIAAIVAAIIVIGALFMWYRNGEHTATSASSPATTVGQSKTAPAPVTPGSAPVTPAAPSK